MRVVVLKDFGEASALRIEEHKKPVPGNNEVLIKVAAAGLNRADIAQRKGHYPAPEGTSQKILGLEVAGHIEAQGVKVKEWEVGEEVCALLPGGGYAEYVTVDAGSCLPIPRSYTLNEAAGLPETLFTVWHNVFQRGGLQQGEQVLIYGGSGGIGSMAIQLAKRFGAHVNALASTDKKIQYCKALGAHSVLNYKTADFINEWGQNSMDLIFDSFGGDYLNTNIDLLKPEGRLVYINAMRGGHPQLDLFKMLQKRIWITGSTLRSRPIEFKKKLRDEIHKKAFPFLESDGFDTMVNRQIPVEKVVEAHQIMESRNFTGKIVLTF